MFRDSGSSAWGRGYPAADDARSCAAAEWAATARAVVARALEPGGGIARPAGRERSPRATGKGMLAEVVGDGVLAVLIRNVLHRACGRLSGGGSPVRHPAVGPAGPPDLIIETSGTAVAVSDALERVGALGTVVLAAPPVTSVMMVRTYADVHRRGLSVVGVPWTGPEPDPPQEHDALAAAALEHLRPWNER
ncbi:hypothetical protein ETD86_13220 [Nonomuraea turkmeniaca]|uniref:Uncharacterized protein n=1 Tax=Nonomuraea turkmeniaca TaxID=103838 RepID=A0A5S4FMS6_9ACTN|nr:hypothetical protein [Nonomuraea turkmeniaca]TMR21982.1 hypothetical protein ETD86_13220 [Nonomuraea turkmeniaca]